MRGGDRLEQRELSERLAAGGDEALELGDARIGARAPLEVREACVEDRPLDLPDGAIVDVLLRREARDARAVLRVERTRGGRIGEIGHALDVDVHRVEEAPVGRMIGTGAVPVVREQRMQRIDADEAAARARGGFAEQRERSEIPDALVAAPPQRIQVRREPEPARAVAQVRRQEAAVRRDENTAFDPGAVVGFQRVDAGRQRRQREHPLRDSAAVGGGDDVRREVVQREVQQRVGSILVANAKRAAATLRRGQRRQRDLRRSGRARHDRRRQRAALARVRERREVVADRAG